MNRKHISEVGIQKVAEAFRQQSVISEDLGSPFVGRLCSLLAERLRSSSRIVAELAELPEDTDLVLGAYPLRVAGALHGLVLTGKSKELSEVFPPVAEPLDDDELWDAVERSLHSHSDFVLRYLKSAPQTNEVRRAGILLPGFLTIAELARLPFRLLEIGASAGLNLNWDRFGYRLGSTSWGDQSSTVQLEPSWSGKAPPALGSIEITEKSGCDLHPLDPERSEDRRRLLSYIWPDQMDRLQQIRAALDIARSAGGRVAKADAVGWLRSKLRPLTPGIVHVIYHSSVWMYFNASAQRAGRDVLKEAGSRATFESPVAWLRFEPDGEAPGGALTLTLWPQGEERCLARADYHGRWVNWFGWT